MTVTSRQGLIDYALRELGDPVIEINVDDQQVEDRIDDALQLFAEQHFDGVEKVYLTHTITQTDIDNEWIPISNAIISIIRVIPTNSGFSGDIFNEEFQFFLNDMNAFVGTGLIQYYQFQENISLIQYLFNNERTIMFNRKQNRLFIEEDWSKEFNVGDILVFETWRMLDPETFTEVYDDWFLKKYTIALIKKQWGNNLKKFDGIVLAGGVTLNGQAIHDEAVQEIADLEQKIKDEFQIPPRDFIG